MKRLIFILALLLVAALAGGCGSSKKTTRAEVIIPPGRSAENYVTDTAETEPPEIAPPRGRPARPERIERWPEPLTEPAAAVVEITVDEDEVAVTTPTSTSRFRAPAPGERLRIRPLFEDTSGTSTDSTRPAGQLTTDRLTGHVEGEPEPRRVDALVTETEEASLWDKLTGLPAWVLAILILVVLGAAVKLATLFT